MSGHISESSKGLSSNSIKAQILTWPVDFTEDLPFSPTSPLSLAQPQAHRHAWCFIEHLRHIPIWEYLHWLLLLSGTCFPQMWAWLPPSYSSDLYSNSTFSMNSCLNTLFKITTLLWNSLSFITFLHSKCYLLTDFQFTYFIYYLPLPTITKASPGKVLAVSSLLYLQHLE